MRLRAVLLPLAAGSLALGLATGATPRACAQATDTLGAVTVTAARVAVPAAEAPSRVTALGREAVRATAAASVADLLEARAPLHVRRYGASGLATATIRGASASQALLLLDGQPVTDPQLGQVDLSLLPTALLDGVEVMSGPASGLYGSAAVGGVVHLRTSDLAAPRATLDVGPWGERRLSARASGGTARTRALVAVEGAQAEDDYSFADRTRIGSPRVARAGWDSRQTSLYAALAHDGGRTGGRLSVWAADAERGLGGDGAVGERQWNTLARVAGTAYRTTRRARLALAGSLQRSRLRYANPYPSTRADAIDDAGRTTAATLDLRVGRSVAGWDATAQLVGGAGRGEHPSLGDALDRFVGAALSAQGRAGRLGLFPSLRADLYVPEGAGRQLALSPQVGANLELASAVRLKASAARAFRMPTLNDRFWQPGGNPDLRPERAWSADAGLAWAGAATGAEVSAFATAAADQIVWAPTAAGVWSPANVDRTRTVGLEASAHAARPLAHASVELGALATVQRARDAGTDAPLRYVPAWTAKSWGGLAVGAVRADLGVRAVGRRYTTASASQPLPAYLVVDAQLTARRVVAGVGLALSLAAENLTDARYEIVQSYPMPPRHARVRLTVQSPR